MQRTRACAILLALSTFLLYGCTQNDARSEPMIDLREAFPSHLPLTGDSVWRFDVDQDEKAEWLALYHVDLIVDNPQGSPTIGAVYRPVADQDIQMSPSLIPALLWLPAQGYLCLHTCEPEMWDVISTGPDGGAHPELVILDRICVNDKCEETVGAALFRWDPMLTKGSDEYCSPSWNPVRAACVPGGFVPLGHFRGDRVDIDPAKLDVVTVVHNQNDRSDLAIREVYRSRSGHFYRESVRSVYEAEAELDSPDEAEVIFALDRPERSEAVKLPEKLVMSFYLDYTDVVETEKYFTTDAWNRIGRDCSGGICGCSSRREEVARVMVKRIAYQREFKKSVKVLTDVICIRNDGQPDPKYTVIWVLSRQIDETWRLSDIAQDW